MAAYATASDLVARYDIEVIGQLATDDGVRLLRDDILAHPNVEAALVDACGDIEVNIRVGGRYTPAQLAALDTHSTAHLKRVVCTIAMSHLFERRPGLFEEQAESIRKRAYEALDRLAKGINIFGLADEVDPQLEASQPSLQGPSSYEIEDRNFLSARMAGRHVPDIKPRNPLSRG